MVRKEYKSSSLKNLEDLVNSSLCFNQNVPYATIMLQDIKIVIKELIANICANGIF